LNWDKCSTSNQINHGSVHHQVLSKNQCERIFSAVLEVLERTGTKVYNEEALELLKKAGCRTDGERVYIPSRLVEKAITSAPSRITLADRNGKRRLKLEGRNTYFGPGPTNPNFIDLETGIRRKVLRQDVCDVATVVDALSGLDFCMSLACISDVTPVLADVHEVKAMLENTIKPIVTWAFNRENNAAIVELCEAAAGGAAALRDNPSFVLYTEPATPLKHPKESRHLHPRCAGQRHRTRLPSRSNRDGRLRLLCRPGNPPTQKRRCALHRRRRDHQYGYEHHHPLLRLITRLLSDARWLLRTRSVPRPAHVQYRRLQ